MFSPTQKISNKVALCIFLAWALFTSFEFWGFGPASYVKIPDAADHILASRLAIDDNISQKENGYWDPDQLAGIDRTAQADSLGVIDLIFVWLPGWLAYGMLMFVQRFIAGYFLYLLLTRHLEVKPLIAIVPGLFYALFPQAQINVQFEGFTVYDTLVVPGVPLLLLCLGSLARTANHSFWFSMGVAFGVGLLFANLSAFIFTIFIFPLILFWLVFIYPRNLRAGLLVFGAFFAGWFCIEFFSMYATYYYSHFSQRGLRESCIGPGSSFHPLKSFFAHILKPSNLPILGAAAIGIAAGKNENRHTTILLVLLGTVYFLLSQYFPVFVCGTYNIIGLPHGLNYSRFFIYLPFLLAALAGTGLQAMFNLISGPKHHALANVLIFSLLAGVIYLSVDIKRTTLRARLEGSNYANVFENPYLTFLAHSTSQEAVPSRVAALVEAEAPLPISTGFLWAYGLNTIDGYTRLYSNEFSQFWQLVIKPTMTQYPTCRYGLKLLDGNNRVSLSNACELKEEIDLSNLDAWFDMDLLSLANVKYFVSTRELTTENLRLIDTGQVQCPATIPGCTKYFLYENSRALPLAFSVSDTLILSEKEKVTARLSTTDFSRLATTAILLEADARGLPINKLFNTEVQLTFDQYSSDQIELTFESAAPKIVIVTWTYSPDWSATIDGDLTRVFPVDLAFMAIYVPEGMHRIQFSYNPSYTPVELGRTIWRRLNN